MIENWIGLGFKLGDGTKLVCDQVRVLGFGWYAGIGLHLMNNSFWLSGSREDTSRLHKANAVMSLRILRKCFSVVICQLSL